ncbi:hypothetical protein GHT06_017421 [Daphnia sinensis]|uniref:Uncharacterized protein n=1 Tax=Daphnia sinensis TaxID=1820382 RepID=A0AAD5PTU2_9CRUS|nr:hypothetical protein GHT06_017421 [Daphnia sinensis]
MNIDNKRLGGLLNGMPSYHMLSNQSQNPQNNDLIKLIQQEENKFWSVRPLYVFATLQMIFGLFLFSAQIALYHESCHCENMKNSILYKFDSHEHIPTFLSQYCECHSSTFAIWCGGIIFLTGLLCALATKYKTNFLLVVSSFLCVAGYGISIFCLVMSAIETLFESDNVMHRGTYVGMAVVSGLNFLISVLTSALFCRASCSCCQPHTPTIMYLSSVDGSSSNLQNEVSDLPR